MNYSKLSVCILVVIFSGFIFSETVCMRHIQGRYGKPRIWNDEKHLTDQQVDNLISKARLIMRLCIENYYTPQFILEGISDINFYDNNLKNKDWECKKFFTGYEKLFDELPSHLSMLSSLEKRIHYHDFSSKEKSDAIKLHKKWIDDIYSHGLALIGGLRVKCFTKKQSDNIGQIALCINNIVLGNFDRLKKNDKKSPRIFPLSNKEKILIRERDLHLKKIIKANKEKKEITKSNKVKEAMKKKEKKYCTERFSSNLFGKEQKFREPSGSRFFYY